MEANWILLAIVCLCAQSLLLWRLKQSTKHFNFYGTHGCGKTLAIQVGATLFGCGIDPAQGESSDDPPYISNAASTESGLEVLMANRGSAPALLDEQTEQGHNAYRASSGSTKNRATSSLKKAERQTWQINVLSTAEQAMSQMAIAAGKPMRGGEMDRAIDIPIEDKTLENFLDKGDFQNLSHHLKDACSKYYGTAGRKLIRYILDNPNKLESLVEIQAEIEKLLAPKGCNAGMVRVVKHFAGTVVAGLVAKEAGILKCDEDTIFLSVKKLTELWWRERAPALGKIAHFLNDPGTKVLTGYPRAYHPSQVFLHERMVVIGQKLFEDTFDKNKKAMLEELSNINALVRDQPERRAHRFDNNRFFGYAIPADQLSALITKPEILDWLNALGATAPESEQHSG